METKQVIFRGPYQFWIMSYENRMISLKILFIQTSTVVTLKPLLPRLSNIVRMATAKADQGGNTSNNGCGLPFQISIISDKISQNINPQKSSKDFDEQNPGKSSSKSPARTHSDRRNSFSKSAQNQPSFTKLIPQGC